MLRMKLSEIATLQTGLVLNRKEARYEEETERVYRRVTMRSLNEYGVLKRNDIDVFPSIEKLDPSVLTHKKGAIRNVKGLINKLFVTLLYIPGRIKTNMKMK